MTKWTLFALSLVIAPAAFSSIYENGIIDGVGMTWAGSSSNTNTINTYWGEITVNSVHIDVSGVTITTAGSGKTSNFVFSEDGTGSPISQGASQIFYLYLMVTGTTPVSTWVISRSQPNNNGCPSDTLQFIPTGGSSVVTSTNGVFVGSYLTDASSNMIPFMRNGDETILTPTIAASDWPVSFDTTYTGSIAFASSDTFPEHKTSTFTNLVPLSASAAIFDFSVSNTDTLSHSLKILNPSLISMGTSGDCTAAAQQTIPAAPSSAGPSTYSHRDRIKTATNSYIEGGYPGTPTQALNEISAGMCGPMGTGTVTLYYSFIGYVEVAHHVTY